MALSGGGCNLQVIVVPIYAIQAYGLQGQVQLLRCDFSQAMDWSGKNLSSGGPKKEPRSNSKVTDHVPGLGRVATILPQVLWHHPPSVAFYAMSEVAEA